MTCKYDDCTKPARGRGWCSTHWLRWRKYGDPSIVHRLGVDYRVAATCSINDCTTKVKAHGYRCHRLFDRAHRLHPIGATA